MPRQLSWDDTYCPKGHGDWVFVPASILYSDVYWCPICGLFYQPTVEELSPDEINKDYSTDRASDLLKRAEFTKWKENLTYKDMEESK